MKRIKDYHRLLGFIAVQLILGFITSTEYGILWLTNIGIAMALMFLASKIEEADKKKSRRKR